MCQNDLHLRFVTIYCIGVHVAPISGILIINKQSLKVTYEKPFVGDSSVVKYIRLVY